MAAAAVAQPLDIGHAPSAETLSNWDTDVGPDGSGLPAGRGSVAEGRALFGPTCSGCHALGTATPALMGPALAGGRGSLATAHPIRTVGSYWPFATTLFDYIRRAMPFNAPQSLSNDQVYAVTAFLLNVNGIVPDGAVMDADSLRALRMPNRDGFRPVWPRHD